jgi:predicted AlkP superfamily phosphohydrolase/phosphomutase
VGYLNTDIIQHATLALLTPGAPVYDDADRDGVPDGRLEERQAYLENTYIGADQTLAAAWSAMPPGTFVAAASDHGFAATWKAVYAPRVLADAGLQPEPQTGNCVASEQVLAKACWVGGTAMVYMNVQGREPHGVIAPEDYAAVRQQIMDAWLALDDDGEPVVYGVFTAEQAGALPNGWSTASMAHAEKTGDVIVFLRPPYQFDFAEGGSGAIRDTTVWWAAHGHPPQTGDGLANTNLYATFYLAGPGIVRSRPGRVQAIDIAPTLAYLLGIPAPAQSEGRILRELFTGPCRRDWRIMGCTWNRRK